MVDEWYTVAIKICLWWGWMGIQKKDGSYNLGWFPHASKHPFCPAYSFFILFPNNNTTGRYAWILPILRFHIQQWVPIFVVDSPAVSCISRPMADADSPALLGRTHPTDA